RQTEDLGGGDAHVSLLRVPWRDPAQTETLDEIDLTGLRGGDTWNPWPYAKTNGRDVVWLHAGGLFDPHEIILLGPNGPRQTVLTTDKPAYFDLAHGAVGDGPAARIVLAFRRGLLWRTSADLTTSPEVWRVTPL